MTDQFSCVWYSSSSKVLPPVLGDIHSNIREEPRVDEVSLSYLRSTPFKCRIGLLDA